MSTLIKKVSFIVSEAFSRVVGQSVIADIARATKPEFGDYQCNSAMKFSKTLNLPPRTISEKVIQHLEKNNSYFQKMEIAGPGFINFTLQDSLLIDHLNLLSEQSHCGVNKIDDLEKVVVDFSSPNIAKEMHVGHLRSTIIGDCLARILAWYGYEVVRLNHVGDWGTAFGMLIAYIKEGNFDLNISIELPTLMDWYRKSKARFDSDEAFKRQAQQEVIALQAKLSPAIDIWRKVVAISEKAYQEIYNLLDVKLISRGESFYEPYLPTVISDAEKKGLLTIDSGAKCIFLKDFLGKEGDPLPLIIQKTDGGYNYATTDLAAMFHRSHIEKAKRIIIVTDAGQALHFKMVHQAALQLGYVDETVVFDHVPFGLVLGPDGKKFKTRSGETEKLIDLIHGAIARADQVLADRKVDLSPTERMKLAQVLGVNAIKYADLSTNRTGDYQFSYDKMLKFEGNTAVFLMYSLVRIKSILRKVETSGSLFAFTHPTERMLALHLARFSEILDVVKKDLYPNVLAEYLYVLSEHCNAFFRDCRVEGSVEIVARVSLCRLVERVFTTGMELLGLQTVERM